MPTDTAALPAFLRAPRVPKVCPVNITRIATINDPSGNSRRLWIVRDGRGDVVEVIAGGESDEQTVHARWPYFHSSNMHRFDIGEHQRAHPLNIDVAPAEFRRLARLQPWSEHAAWLRAIGDRFQRYSAIAEAINTVRRDGRGYDRGFDRDRTAVIYQRTPRHGGTHVDRAVRRAMLAAERAGIVQCVTEPGAKHAAIYKQYRATDTTPYIG